MKDLIKMAWRNIWRNKRRTLITAGSIFFAVFFAVFMRSIQLGSYGNMIMQSIEKFSGYLQLQSPEYFDEPSLDNYIEYNDAVKQTIKETKDIRVAAPRIESFVLASTGHQSKGVLVTGIDPEKEKFVSNPEHMLVHYKLTPQIVDQILDKINLEKEAKNLLIFNNTKLYPNLERLALDLGMEPEEFKPYHKVFNELASYKGDFLKKDDNGVLVSSRLATFLKAHVGDSIILMGQGRYGSTAAGLFPIRGIVRIPSPELDNKLIYMTLSNAQAFFDMPNMLTTIVMNIDDKDKMIDVQQTMNKNLDADAYVVKNWHEVNPTLKQQIDGDNVSGQMFLGILYFIIFFGIIGTVMMMVAERKREFGVLVAIGMRKTKLVVVLIYEMVFIGLIGTAAGMLAAMPPIYSLNVKPYRLTGEMAKMYEDMGFEAVMPTAPIDHYFTAQGIIILLMVLLACYIPLRKIYKIKVMNALRA